MSDNSETLTLRPIIGGERHADDYQVFWRGLSIGRIRRGSGATGGRVWTWGCQLPGSSTRAGESVDGGSLDDATAKLRAAWAAIRAGLTEADIVTAQRYVEASRKPQS
jgi:hypothetical protein